MGRLTVPVTPVVMQWCRRKAGLSPEAAAKRIGRPATEIEAWENGSALPTLAQARKAAEVYKRPLAVLFLPEPPREFSTLRDYRLLPVDIPREYSPELAFLIRETQMRQQWTRDFLEADGTAPLEFVGSANLNTPTEELAGRIRANLGITPARQRSCRSREEVLLLWKRAAEAAGIFVFQRGNVDLIEARGFVICDPYAPFVFLNSNDAKAGQLFTLVHELVHIWINESGISNLEGLGRRRQDPEAQIEVFCNRVTAEVLIDRAAFNSAWARLAPNAALEERIELMSADFKVSAEAIARRLLDDGIITASAYQQLREIYQERWREQSRERKRKQKESDSGPSYYRLKVSRDGYAYTQTVLTAYHGGRVSGREISGLLNIKLNHLGKLAEFAGAGPSRG